MNFMDLEAGNVSGLCFKSRCPPMNLQFGPTMVYNESFVGLACPVIQEHECLARFPYNSKMTADCLSLEDCADGKQDFH